MKILITGGLGFIGCNAVTHFASRGHEVFVVDNLSRTTAKHNAAWMSAHNVDYSHANIDLQDRDELARYFAAHRFDAVIHLGGQVAVTTSVESPISDFEINAGGTLNVLENVRKYCPDAIFINASTNKVYGQLKSIETTEESDRYDFRDKEFNGVGETQALDFFSPYGCSKGVADQYTLDYARTYDLRTITLRQSCIYGPHQFGIEDQGWVAWFIIACLQKKPITIYGNGKQVRDLLYIGDLIALYETILEDPSKANGMAFNIGGGKKNAVSLMVLLKHLETIRGEAIDTKFGVGRPGDQNIFVSDNRLAESTLGFRASTSWEDGVLLLYRWLESQMHLLA